MRWNSGTAMRCAILVTVVWCLPGLWSCGENKETTIYETVYADTLHDTLRIHDTTVTRDTLYDTMYVAPGRAQYVLFGIVYDVSSADTTGAFDSAYAGLTCFANPARQDLRVLVNGDSLRREDAEREIVLRMMAPDLYYGMPFPAVNMGALLTGTLWEDFVPARSPYTFEVIVPVHPADTADSMTFDTVRQSVTVPRPVDGVQVSSNAGSHPRTYNARLRDTCYVVPGDSAITLTWNDSADYYVVTVYKLRYIPGYGYDLVDTPYDTIVTAATCRLPRGELSRTGVTGGYDIAEVDFMGINGPEPASWDTLPSFGGRGIALAVSYENHYELLVPLGSPLLAKSLAVEAPFSRTRNPLVAACRALGLPLAP